MKTAHIFIAAFLTLSSFTVINSVEWNPQEDSYAIKFESDGASGIIKGLAGTIQFNSTDLQNSKFDVTVDVNTLNTGNGMKNNHAKNAEWFDAKKFPTIHFTSSGIEKLGNKYSTKGVLTMKGISREIAIPFTFEQASAEGSFNGTFEINRKDFNMTARGVSDIIKIQLLIPVKQK